MKVIFAHDHIFYKFLNKYYSPGGLTLESLNRYKLDGVELTVLARCTEINELRESYSLVDDDQIKFVEIPNFKKVNGWIEWRKAKESIDIYVKNTDIVIARMSSIGNLAARIAQKNNKMFLVEVVGCPFDALWNHSLLGKIISPIEYFNLKKIVSNAPYVSYVTKEFLQKRYPSNGITGSFSNVIIDQVLEEEEVLKKNYTNTKLESSKKIKIGTIGNVSMKYKGHETVIKALVLLKKENMLNFHYYIVGDGNQSRLKTMVEKLNLSSHITFLGHQSRKEVFDFLDFIDIYIQPSKTEGLPRALIEAMSRGKLCIGSDAGGIPELLDKDYIFNKNSPELLAKILSNLTHEVYRTQGIANVRRSKEYLKSSLEKQRNEFISNIYNTVREGVDK